MRKNVGVLLLAGLLLCVTTSVFAQTTDSCYVIARCTVTVAVDVRPNPTAQIVLSTAAANSFVISGSSYVQVVNISTGAICKWRVRVSTQEYTIQDPALGGWTVPTTGEYYWTLRENGMTASTGGVMTASLLCIFAPSTTTACVSTDFDTDNISDDIIGYSWVILDGAKMKHSSVPPDDWPSGGTNADIATGGIRNLFFGIKYPSAVADEFYRRFTVEVNAALPGTAW